MSKLITTETALWRVPPGVQWNSLLASPNANRLAYAVRRRGEWRVVVDGVEGKTWDPPDRVAWGPVFSGDSRRVAYVARNGPAYFVVVNDLVGEGCDFVSWLPVFSRDSQHIAYIIGRGANYHVVTDGVLSAAYEFWYTGLQTWLPVFSPDSRRLAYSARRGGKYFIVVDGVEQKQYEQQVMNPIFSPDGKRMAYIVSPGERAFVVVDGEEQRAYQDIHGNSLCFSPDSGRLAYLARGEHKQILVVDGVEQPFGEDIIVASSLMFRPRSEHPTYIASVFHGGFGKSVAVVDGVRGKEYGDIYEDKLWLSRDGSHVAYLARKDHGLFQGSSSVLVLDGCECMEFRRNDMPRSLWFSPDGKRLAFAPLRPARWFHRQKYYVAVNELEGNEYEGFAPDFGYFVFDGSSALHFMAYRNSEFVRAQVTIAGNSGG